MAEGDERDALREAVRRGLRMADAAYWGGEMDPDQLEDYVDGVVESLLGEATDHPGWLILGGLGHVYRLKDGKMADATHPDHSVWSIRTRNQL